MMLATLHGKRNNDPCLGCSGSCSDCQGLHALGGWWSDAVSWTGDAAGTVYDTASNVVDAGTNVLKAAGSTISDVAHGDFAQALRDGTRTVTAVAMGIPNTVLALTSHIPGIDKLYPLVLAEEKKHSEAIAIAAAAIGAVILSAGLATVILGPASAIASSAAASVAAATGVSAGTVTTVTAALGTAASVVVTGKKLLDSGKLTPDQTAIVQSSVDAAKADPSYVAPSTFPWYLAGIPLLLKFL